MEQLGYDLIPNCPWFDYPTLAKILKLHPDTVRRMFKDAPKLKVPPKYRGARVTHRIPRPVVVEVITRLLS